MQGEKFWNWKRTKPAIPKGDGGLRWRTGGKQRWAGRQADPSIDFPSSRSGNMPPERVKKQAGRLNRRLRHLTHRPCRGSAEVLVESAAVIRLARKLIGTGHDKIAGIVAIDGNGDA